MKKRHEKEEIRWVILIVCFLLLALVSVLGSMFTTPSIKSGWYETIKPVISPPNWLFGPVWTILYILIAISLYFAWTSAKTAEQKKQVGVSYGINLFANITWSAIFFGFQNPLLAFIDILLILLTIITTMLVVRKLNVKSVYLLVPYLIWVSFATILNLLSI